MSPTETLAKKQKCTCSRLCISALFEIAKSWKQPLGSSIGGLVKLTVYLPERVPGSWGERERERENNGTLYIYYIDFKIFSFIIPLVSQQFFTVSLGQKKCLILPLINEI